MGWIDGIMKRIDAETHVQRFTPRRKGSNWSAINVDKVARLTAEGRMRPAGLAAFEARTDAGTGVTPTSGPTRPSPMRRPRASGPMRRPGQTGSAVAVYRRTVTYWITSAKQAATRERRLAALIADSRAGVEVRPMRAARGGS